MRVGVGRLRVHTLTLWLEEERKLRMTWPPQAMRRLRCPVSWAGCVSGGELDGALIDHPEIEPVDARVLNNVLRINDEVVDYEISWKARFGGPSNIRAEVDSPDPRRDVERHFFTTPARCSVASSVRGAIAEQLRQERG